jgi:plastocyanin
MKAHLIAGLIAAAMVAAGAVACGGDSNSGGSGGTPPTTPSTTPPGAVNTTTITITNNAVSPKDIIVARGSQVNFVNNDSRAHDMASNPHPAHTDCPEINQAGFLNPGQSRQTGNLNTARICGFHDHNADTVVAMQGTITVQ